jgi:YD repeat-containing protein
MAYDRWGNTVLVVDRAGQSTISEYDGRGRLCRRVVGGVDVGNVWDDLDRPLSVAVESGGTVLFEYEGDGRNPVKVTDPAGGVTRYVWDRNLLLGMVDPAGVVTRFTYDLHGDVVAVTDGEGNTSRLVRDGQGRIVETVTPSGSVTRFTYDKRGCVVARRDADGAVWRFSYSQAGRLQATTDPLGAVTRVTYGGDGVEQARTDPLGRVVERTVNDLGLVSSIRLPDGQTWLYRYDALSRLTSITDPDGGRWGYEYGRTGEVTEMVDPTGVRVSMVVDVVANRVAVSDGVAAGSVLLDPLGRVDSVEVNGHVTSVMVRDGCGRPLEVLDAQGGLMLLRRDLAGRVVEQVTPAGVVSRFEYDRCGRLARRVNGRGDVWGYTYNVDGWLVSIVSPLGEEERFDYDGCGRMVGHYQPGSGQFRCRFDKLGRMVWLSDPYNGQRQYRYDQASQLVEVVNGLGGVTRYSYDQVGRVRSVTDPLGGVTGRCWNGLGRLVEERGPSGRVVSAGYDLAGRPTWQMGADGHRFDWEYDVSGREKTFSVDDGLVLQVDRDLTGGAVTIHDYMTGGDRARVHRFVWDCLGRLVGRERDGQVVSWGYDADGRRTSFTDVQGRETGYVYDGLGQLAGVSHPLFGDVSFGCDRQGRVVVASGGGFEQVWVWGDGQVAAHRVTDAAGGVCVTRVGRDGLGRVVQVVCDGKETRYGFDDAGQLVSTDTDTGDGEGVGCGWVYDVAGRLVESYGPDGCWTHCYSKAGELILSEHTGSGFRVEHSYDLAGRRTQTRASDGWVRCFSWTPSGWLNSVETHDADGGCSRMVFEVDGTGQLVKVGGVPVWWDQDGRLAGFGDEPVMALGAVCGVGDGWVPAGWRPVRASDATNPWTLTDGLVGGLGTDGLAGELGTVGGPDGVRVGLAGELWVDGLEWLGVRVYDAGSFGFLSPDPLEAPVGAVWCQRRLNFDPLLSIEF